MENKALLALLGGEQILTHGKGFKRAYFKQQEDLVFRVLERGATYADIRAAFAADGVEIGRQYFKELMLEAKRARSIKTEPIAQRKQEPMPEPKPKRGLLDSLREKYMNAEPKILTGADAARIASERGKAERGQ